MVPWDQRDPRDQRDLRDQRDPRDPRDQRDPPRDSRDPRDMRASRDREPRDLRDPRSLRDPFGTWGPQDLMGSQGSRDPMGSQGSRPSRERKITRDLWGGTAPAPPREELRAGGTSHAQAPAAPTEDLVQQAIRRNPALKNESYDKEYTEAVVLYTGHEEKLTESIVKDILSVPTTSYASPWTIFLAGGPGSGKGSVFRHLQAIGCVPRHPVVIDCDAIRIRLPQWDQYDDKLVAVKATQVQAGYIADTAMRRCIREGRSFVFDSTMRNFRSAVEFLARLRIYGFRTCVIFVDTLLEVCQKRVEQRRIKTGRPVQPEFVIECNRLSREVHHRLKDLERDHLFITLRNDSDGAPAIPENDLQQLRCFTELEGAGAVGSTRGSGQRQAGDVRGLTPRDLCSAHVRIDAAYDLKNLDTGYFGDVSDPYVSVEMGGEKKRTRTINNNLNPTWTSDNEFVFEVDRSDTRLRVEIFNDNLLKDQSLGYALLELQELPPNQWHALRQSLQDGQGEVEFYVYLGLDPSAKVPVCPVRVGQSVGSRGTTPRPGRSESRLSDQAPTIPAYSSEVFSSESLRKGGGMPPPLNTQSLSDVQSRGGISDVQSRGGMPLPLNTQSLSEVQSQGPAHEPEEYTLRGPAQKVHSAPHSQSEFEAGVEQLAAMGFDPEVCAAALEGANGDLDRAVDLLMSQVGQ